MEEVRTYHTVLQQGYLTPHQIPSKLRLCLSADLEEKEKTAIQIEIKCFEFSMRNGTLLPQIDRIDENGNRHCYPDLERFTHDEWIYIEQRSLEQSHPFIRSRYAHLLWLKKKHNRYAQQAIKSYKELATLYFQKSHEEGGELYHKFCTSLKCYHLLSSIVKFETDNCKHELLSWLTCEGVPFMWKDNLVEIFIESPLFKAKDCQGLTNLMLSFVMQEQYGYTEGKNYLETLLQLAQKENVSNKEIMDLLGENELTLASKRQNDQTGIIPYTCYKRAANYFKLADIKEKYDRAIQLYTAQKHKIKLGVISTELSDEHVQRYNQILNSMVDDLLSGDPYRPFLFLATDSSMLLPKEKNTELTNQQRQNSITNLFTWEVFDQNNNGRTLTKDEKIRLHQFQNYSLHLQCTAVPLIQKLFYKGFRTGHITPQTFITFFSQTWLAQSLNGFTVDGEPSPFSWMELLGPGLYELAKELEAEILDKDYKPNYILPIDSISIKLEGAIRNFAQVAGVPVTKLKEGETQEMNLEELLNKEDVLALFEKDDVLLWRTVLTKKGWNTRNNTAHGFYQPVDYSREKAILLLLCVYRLSSYIISNNSSDD